MGDYLRLNPKKDAQHKQLSYKLWLESLTRFVANNTKELKNES